MTVKVLCGECVEVMAGMAPDSFDAIVTDPPYHLTTGKNGGTGVASLNIKSPAGRSRVTTGFMGKAWDGGDVAFRPETWAAVFRVLRPGAHLVAMGGTRTFHRLVCAIEDAGFEIRDTIAWVYASGFPKSLDVSKAIDRRGGADIGWFGPWLRQERERRDITQKQLARYFPSKTGNLTGCVANWELSLNLPTVEQFNLLCEILELPFSQIEEAEREVIGQRTAGIGTGNGSTRIVGDRGRDITAPATDAAKQWQGWGTSLKPAMELICVARKPLSEANVAANVLRHGTGALNIDATRIPLDGIENHRTPARPGLGKNGIYGANSIEEISGKDLVRYESSGRWPANVCHDGSPEVLEAFAKYGERASHDTQDNGGVGGARFSNVYDKFVCSNLPAGRGDIGTAARFFFTAKAASWEREGGHPTVKPQALMEFLLTLVVPPGGAVLDPFCGTGSTLVAADWLGIEAVGIEQDPKTCADAEAKIRRLRARRMLGDVAKPEAPAPGQMSLL